MIQDIAPHQYRNEYQPIKPTANSILLCYKGRNLLLRREGEEVVYPTFKEAVNAGVDEGDLYHTYTYLFTIDLRKFHQPAGRAAHHPLFFIMHHRLPTSSAKTSCFIPVGKLPSCNAGK